MASLNDLNRIDPLIVAGIDPGTRAMGFGIVGRRGRQHVEVDHGVFSPSKDAHDIGDRLLELRAHLKQLFDHHRPHVVALEEAFLHKNVQSTLRLGEARAVVLITAAEHRIPVVQYPTAVAKKAVTGHGGASKEVVQDLVRRHLDLPQVPTPHDAADALALALCLLFDPRLDPRFTAAAGDSA